MLCSYCRAIAENWPSDREQTAETWTFKHYDSESDLDASATSGCSLCAQFLGGKLDYVTLYMEPKSGGVEVRHQSVGHVTRWQLVYTCSISGEDEDSSWVEEHIVYAVDPVPQSKYGAYKGIWYFAIRE